MFACSVSQHGIAVYGGQHSTDQQNNMIYSTLVQSQMKLHDIARSGGVIWCDYCFIIEVHICIQYSARVSQSIVNLIIRVHDQSVTAQGQGHNRQFNDRAINVKKLYRSANEQI